MSEHTLTIVKKNGESFMISMNEGMRVLTYVPSSPLFQTEYEKLSGRHGLIDVGGAFEAQDNIKSRIYFRSKNINDFCVFRDQIFRLFASQDPFYIISSRAPEKRWKVRVASRYEIEPKGKGTYGVFDITFRSSDAFAESTYSTLEWMQVDYTRTTSNFTINNKGAVEIDPRQMPLRITFKGASENLKIKNKTTKEEWTYTGITTDKDTIVIDQVRSTKNSLSIVRDTNKKVISLQTGINEFEIIGAKGAFSISFDFRFQYL
ncbi:phage tail family protein [Bacillus toyonensis]|uniref:phage tail family protein n=1 Tax=Bacillus toyonensis TaxID=155322 RepID=UPI0011A8F5E0|nr:phage tail family protein [Bacillus toyonensis]